MRLLLDTHALIWWLFDDPKLSTPARRAISDVDNEMLVSSASAWEIATKHRRGKLPEAGDLVQRFEHYIAAARFAELPITAAHALAAGRLPGPHKDPFDRVLIAQARLEKLTVVTIDPVFADYGAEVLWH
ncbi:MAG: type II toxin-antitoxin system VapC family toxin [Geminicoccaceae bacterium]